MTTTIPFEGMLELVDERSATLRSALAGALDAPVPGCPEWAGRDLIAHLGEVHRFWAATVRAGTPDAPVGDGDVPERTPTGDLLDWSERSTEALLAALRDAGPDRPVWTWWGQPALSGAVARHQVQEATVHAWDAQDTIGRAGPLRAEAAADGIAEFLAVGLPAAGAWPHEPATVDLVATDAPGAGRRVVLDAAGSRAEPLDGPDGSAADAELRGPASDLVLVLYGRRSPGTLAVDGDRELAGRLLGWFDTQ